MIIKNVNKQSLTDAERLQLCQLLVKSGYCVRLVKQKTDTKKNYEKFIEFEE